MIDESPRPAVRLKLFLRILHTFDSAQNEKIFKKYVRLRKMSIRNPRTRSSGPELVGLVIETVSSGPWTPDMLSDQILKQSTYLFLSKLEFIFFRVEK